jgi:hypothetical protein
VDSHTQLSSVWPTSSTDRLAVLHAHPLMTVHSLCRAVPTVSNRFSVGDTTNRDFWLQKMCWLSMIEYWNRKQLRNLHSTFVLALAASCYSQWPNEWSWLELDFSFTVIFILAVHIYSKPEYIFRYRGNIHIFLHYKCIFCWFKFNIFAELLHQYFAMVSFGAVRPYNTRISIQIPDNIITMFIFISYQYLYYNVSHIFVKLIVFK